ncbi:MAG: hypothetical protein R2849_10445 [Thermomicrobiales bacterium]
MILVAGFDRIWEGAHWPTDVLAAYSLGGLLLIGIVAAYRRIDIAAGHLPFVKAAYVKHDENREHAHALTSTVFFNGNSVSKCLRTGLRAASWLTGCPIRPSSRISATALRWMRPVNAAIWRRC